MRINGVYNEQYIYNIYTFWLPPQSFVVVLLYKRLSVSTPLGYQRLQTLFLVLSKVGKKWPG